MEGNLKDPYKVLGLNKGASETEIKDAYKKLVKKYHPDQYANNPLSDLAEEKLEEINKAYNYLMKNKGYSSEDNFRGTGFNNNYNHHGNSIYLEVRDLINRNNLAEAEQILNSIGEKDAEWFFLRGVIYMRRGWYDQGYRHINRAVAMDPANEEYRATLNNLRYQNTTYRTTARDRGNESCDVCDFCTCLFCSDCCCECLGGDLISCC